MHRLGYLVPRLAVLLASMAGTPLSAASFVYYGQLEDRGQRANGRYDVELTLYADPAFGPSLASPIVFAAMEVIDGSFRLDFEAPLSTREDAWVELAVREAGSDRFSAISGRTRVNTTAAAIGACWSTLGDSGSNPATNFLGTTDNQPLVLRTANARSLRIEPANIGFGAPALPITTNTISGSHANEITDGVRGGTIAGGGLPSGDSDPDYDLERPNRVTDHYGTVAGGFGNQAGDNLGSTSGRPFATVVGGQRNTASGSWSLVGGGRINVASGSYSSVAGGNDNESVSSQSTVSGGASNTASGSSSTVVGGSSNTASGPGSTTGGGALNCAGGTYSWAGGFRAKVRPGSASGVAGSGCAGVPTTGTAGDQGSFVWADAQGTDFLSTGSNQFLARADGGFGFNTNNIPPGIEAVLQGRSGSNANVDLYLKPAAHSRGINLAMLPGTGAAAFYISQYDGSSFIDRILLAANGDFSVTQQAFKPGGGAWAVASDARLKTAVEPLRGALEQLLALRGISYEYRPETTPKSMYLPGRLIGFIAQDVENTFPQWIGRTEDGYRTVGTQGFEALTVEALRELRSESATLGDAQDQRIRALEADNAGLRAELAELRRLVETMDRRGH